MPSPVSSGPWRAGSRSATRRGSTLTRGDHLDAEHRHVGYLPQDYGLFPHMTVAQNVRFAARRDRPDLLERLGIAQLAGARPRQLSGGERQRAALARALGREPRVLLLDEPFGALDAITRRQVRDELADLLAELALPSLLVTHAFEDAIALARRVGVLDRGRLVQLGAPRELFERPANAMVAELTGANVLHGDATPTSSGSLIRLDGGGELACSTTGERAGSGRYPAMGFRARRRRIEQPSATA